MEQYDVRCVACGKVIDIHDAWILDLMDDGDIHIASPFCTYACAIASRDRKVQKLKRKVEMLETSIPTPPENKEQKERNKI